MIRIIDQIAAALVALIGLVHLGAGHGAFLAPTERGVWFLSAGFLLIVTGLANVARARTASRSRLIALAALAGALSILISGALLAASDSGLLFEPQTLVLLALGVLLTAFSLRDLVRRR